MIEKTPEESRAQEEVAAVARELAALRYRLRQIPLNLPPSPIPYNPAADLDGEPDVATELRTRIDCVIADCLTPAVADLETASLYRPAAGRERGGAA